MITLFKHNNPIALILLLVLATLPEWRGTYEAFPNGNNTALLQRFFEDYLHLLKNQTTGLRIVNTLMLLAESLYLNKIINDHRLMEKPGFIPAMTFLLVQAILPFRITTFFILINGLVLIMIKLMIIVYKQERANNNLIGAGFTVGLLATLNSGYWTIYLWLITALFIMRPASSKEWLICTLGFLMPFYFILSLQYLNDQLDIKQFLSDFGLAFIVPVYNPIIWLKISLIALLSFIGLWIYSSAIGKMVIQNRKTYMLIFILVLVFLGLLVIKFGNIALEIMLLVAPASFLIAPIFISFKKEFIPNLLFFLLIVLALIR